MDAISATSAPVVRVEGLRFDYPGVRALDNVAFSVEPGSVTALVGPNGAGKTTLLRCVAGLERPMLGTVEVAGVDVVEEPRLAHRQLGYLSDFFGLYDALSVRRCLTHAAAAQAVPEERVAAAVGQAAARLGLADRLEQPAGTLSRGLRQRVAIGQAIIHSPRVVLLDEPASGLDPEARHSLALLFVDLARSGITLIVSSHILAELDEYSSHMLLMSEGRIVEHRALIAAPGAVEVGLALACADARLEPWLRERAGVDIVAVDSRSATVRLQGGEDAQAELVRALVEAGFALSSAAPVRADLHASYLRTVQATRAGGA
jgi:ABC-2 type transport system ATP-binding protein